jgi:hypothetical protein
VKCIRENDLLDALGRGFVGSELSSHVAACESCTELQTVAGALLYDRAQAITTAAIPSAGTMWWRMQLRLRQETESAAQRSLLIGQAATLAVAIVLMFALFGADVAVGVRDAVASIHLTTRLVLFVAVPLVLAPLAGWVAVRTR